MSRKPLIATRLLPYHVTNRANNKDWFYISIERVWQIFCEVLTRSVDMYRVEIHCFVLMSNHYHLLVSTPLGNLNFFMRHFQTEVCREIQRVSGRTNHVFGGRYRWSVLLSSSAVAYTYKYILRNPLRAGMVSRVEHYPFSSFGSLLQGLTEFPMTELSNHLWSRIPKNGEERLGWLNQPTPRETEQLIGKALRRFEFQFSRGNDLRLGIEQLAKSYGVENAPATFSAEK